MFGTPVYSLLTGLLIAGLTPSALAQTQQNDDGVQLKAGLTVQNDSNFFRLSASTPLPPGRSSASERTTIGTVGVSFNKTYSLQDVSLEATLVRYQYANATDYNSLAKNYSANWGWRITPAVHGSLYSSRLEVLNSFSDFQDYTQRNMRVNTSSGATLQYDLDGVWRLLGGVASISQTNQLAVLDAGDYKTQTWHAGVRHDFKSGSRLGYTLRVAHGSYLNRTPSQAALLDDGFDQTEHELKLQWAVDGKSSLNATLTQLDRTHPHYTQRDYGGTTGSLNAVWNPSAKTTLSGTWSRSLGNYQDADYNYSQTDRLSLGTAWQLGNKTLARLNYELARRDYLGTPFAGVGNPRQDILRDTSLSLDWQPQKNLTFSTSLQNSNRTTNLVNSDYDSNMLSLSIQLTY